ncbi:DNA repair family protein [Paecilomyces variotii No. 5]|uniref:DNA repair family protein n=1 Tax=Byssochlamys spectabilis (strain No. 5 / NBRC 109023) TaxID=1356009 RepID=V5HU74_BYSSN|nr:DNA repair family protein [Paecilomyces variotii No. 5]
MSKRTLDAFFKPSPAAKKSRTDITSTSTSIRTTHDQTPAIEKKEKQEQTSPPSSVHPTYPFPIPALDSSLSASLSLHTPSKPPKHINDQPHLDLLYFQHCIQPKAAQELFLFLRRSLPFYRVKYTIRRGPTETIVNTPRFTTVFGVDETSRFISPPSLQNTDMEADTNINIANNDSDGNTKTYPLLVDSKTNTPVPRNKYKCTPRPIPSCLETLRKSVQSASGDDTTYNFCLVNYYASGEDSISYHSDDERFLGPEPTIASLSLGAKRDFLMRHKPSQTGGSAGTLKLPLGSGDMVIMRGKTQANWLHSIPKRKGGEADRGRINITFRRAVVPGGTENYYRYNVGDGEVYRWDEGRGEMVKWKME